MNDNEGYLESLMRSVDYLKKSRELFLPEAAWQHARLYESSDSLIKLHQYAGLLNESVAERMQDSLGLNESYAALDSIRNLIDPVEGHRSSIERIEELFNPPEESAALKGLNSAFDNCGDSLAKQHVWAGMLNESMANLMQNNPALESVRKFIDPIRSYDSSIALDFAKSHVDSISAIKKLEELFNNARYLTAARGLYDSFSEFKNSFNTLAENHNSINQIYHSMSALNLDASQNSVLERFKDIVTSVNDEIEIDNSGYITLSSLRIRADELQNLSNNIIEISTSNKSSSLYESVEKIIVEIQKQKDPFLQQLLIWLIYPLIVVVLASIINPIADYLVKSHLIPNKRELSKEIKSSARILEIDQELRKSVKFVTADVLNVRAKASQKSDVIGTLSFSSVVIVIEKDRKWTLIEWNNPDTKVSIRGWVFSRYLSKFN